MFGTSRRQMIWLANSMATMLDAGLPVSRILAVLARQARGALRGCLIRAGARIERGDTLCEALAAEGRFPPLFISLVGVGEASGTLERTVGEAARFFELQQRLWRSFIARIVWPVAQYVLAVAVVAFAMYILAALGQPMGDPRGVLILGYGVPAGLVAFYVLFGPALGAARAAQELVLKLPVLGGVARGLALARFSLLMHLMMEAGAPTPQTLRQAFEGTNNRVFAARAHRAIATVEQGGTLSNALSATALFPVEYIEVAVIAEESGKLSERFAWLANHHTERTEFALTALARVATILVWLIVAAVIIYFIFTIFMGYVGTLNKLAR